MMPKDALLGVFAAALVVGLVSAQPVGDYGDAPNGTAAYPGVTGMFPTLYDSAGSTLGGHTLNVGQEMIGVEVSAEKDAKDAADPDGTQNLVDADKDDPVYTLIVATSIPASAMFKFQVKIAGNAPAGPRYINALVDFDKNGSWGGERNGREWAVKNQKIEFSPGSTQWVTTDAFNWGSGMIVPTPVWVRLAITRDPMSANDWKGDGEFQYGEIQDFLVEIKAPEEEERPPPPLNKSKCGNNKREGPEACDGTDDKACPGKCRPDCTCPKPGGGPPPGKPKEPGSPGPDRGPCTTPIKYHALVINAGDNSRRKQGMKAADDIWYTLGEQGYDRGQYLAPYWDTEMGGMGDDGVTAGGYSSLAGIEAAFQKLGQEVKCVDRVMIYIVGHGLKPGGHKYEKDWPTGGIILQGKRGAKEILTPEKLDELISTHLPACPDLDCRTPQKSCHVSVVVESCHSGNFLGPLSKEGRTVAVSCAANEVSSFGKDEDGNLHGGDYTNGYVKDMYSPETADTNNDGFVSVEEAHKSATDKLSVAMDAGRRQTPGFYSNECECLPLSCVGRCGDGKIDPANEEECDYNATPTGCQSDESCDENCKCEKILTPGECPEGKSITQQICEALCGVGKCFLDELSRCWSCLAKSCPTGQYTSADCGGACDDNEACVVANATTPCYKCAVKCDIGEFVDEFICKPACNAGKCIMNALNGCWKCPKQDCEEDQYEKEDECQEDCEDQCQLNEDSNCWYCPIITCENIGMYTLESSCEAACDAPDYCDFFEASDCWDCVEAEETCEERGMYDSEGDCEGDCDEPDYCVYSENYDCWNCQGVSCTGSLHDKSDCDGDCSENEGEVCVKHTSGCYWCVCPDLYVNSLSGSVHRSASTHCSTGGEYGLEVCTTECSLSGTAQFKIKNKGTGPAGTSTARVDLMSSEDALVDSETESVPALAAGQTSSTMTVDLAKYAEVVGKTCDGLDWWTSSYTLWVFADYGDGVKECDEDNNDIHAETSAS